MLAVFAEVLQFWSNSSRFTVSLTLFNRLPLHPQINAIVGDFTSLTLCEIDNREEKAFAAKVRELQARLFSDIDHRLFSGIEVLREMGRQNQSTWDTPLIPIVFTSLLTEESHEHHSDFLSNQVYSITQTPQVWLDYKAYTDCEELVLEWDYVEGLFPEKLIEHMHEAYYGLLETLAKSPEAWEQTFFDLLPSTQSGCRHRVNETKWNVTYKLLHELFNDKAREIPNQPAVIYGDNFLTYQELQKTSNQLVLCHSLILG